MLKGLARTDDLVSDVAGVVSEVVQTVLGVVQAVVQNEEVQEALAALNNAGGKPVDAAQSLKLKLRPKIAELKAELKKELRVPLSKLRQELGVDAALQATCDGQDIP